MALPPKVIERLAWESPETPGWSGRLLMFASTIFFLSLFIYLGLRFGYEPYLNAQVTRLDNQIKTFSQQVPIDQQANIIDFYSQLANLKSILGSHVVASSLFGWFERNTQVNVYFNQFKLSVSARQLSLGGTGKTITDIVQQIEVFKAQPFVQAVTMNSVSRTNEGMWQFSALLKLDPKIFNQSGIPAPLPSEPAATSTAPAVSTNASATSTNQSPSAVSSSSNP